MQATHNYNKYSLKDFELFQIKNVIQKRRFGELLFGIHKQTGFKHKIKRISTLDPNYSYIMSQMSKESKLSGIGALTLDCIFQEDAKEVFAVYPFLEGKPIHKANLDLTGLKTALTLIAEELNIIHFYGFIHGDVKPSNIIIYYIDEELKAQLIDYGQIIKIGEERNDERPFSMIYSPPELMLKRNDLATNVSDYYSLGITFLELLCDKTPFNDEHPEKVMAYMLNLEPEMKGLPLIWKQVISRMTIKEKFPLPPNHLSNDQIDKYLKMGLKNRKEGVQQTPETLKNLEEKVIKKWFFF